MKIVYDGEWELTKESEEFLWVLDNFFKWTAQALGVPGIPTENIRRRFIQLEQAVWTTAVKELD